jgi:hypothetical protein
MSRQIEAGRATVATTRRASGWRIEPLAGLLEAIATPRGARSAETLALKRQITALARMAREIWATAYRRGFDEDRQPATGRKDWPRKAEVWRNETSAATSVRYMTLDCQHDAGGAGLLSAADIGGFNVNGK